MNTSHLSGTPSASLPASFAPPARAEAPARVRQPPERAVLLPAIPMPLRARWDSFRAEVLPALVLSGVLLLVFLLWRAYVHPRPAAPPPAPASMVGNGSGLAEPQP